MKKKTILASIYSANPYKGSEEAMGWNYVYQAARFNNVIAVTRKNNRDDIERYMRENPDPVYNNLRFLYFDLPYWMRAWKKGSRGVILYYLMWQRAIPSFVRKQAVQFDIVHNLNFHNDWSPSYLWKLGKPFVWGPIGHHPRIPTPYLEHYPLKSRLKDHYTWLIKKLFWNFSPCLEKTISKADYIWCMNSSVMQVIDLTGKSGHVSPSVAAPDPGNEQQPATERFTLISAGRLVPLKGYDMAIRAFARFMQTLNEKDRARCELKIVGSGPEADFYKELVQQEGMQQHVDFVKWLPRPELMNLFRQSSAFLFPSHEGAGMVVPEALSFGLPVLCLKNVGPGEMIDPTCGFTVPAQEYEATVSALAGHISQLFHNPELLHNMSRNARRKFETHFDWNVRGEQLRQVYNSVS